MNIVKEASFGVVPVYKNEDGTYLFCLVKHTAGHWAFPKGHRDASESEVQTAQRELFEETGISDVQIDPNKRFIESYSFLKNDTRHEKSVIYFIGINHTIDHNAKTRYESEIVEARWLLFAEAMATLTFPESHKILEEVGVYLSSKKQ